MGFRTWSVDEVIESDYKRHGDTYTPHIGYLKGNIIAAPNRIIPLPSTYLEIRANRNDGIEFFKEALEEIAKALTEYEKKVIKETWSKHLKKD